MTEPDFHHEKGYSIGKQPRNTTEEGLNNPGPGKYHPKTFYRSTPQYSIGLSEASNHCERVPGPGAYNPNNNYIKHRPNSAKMGTSNRNTTRK